MIRIALDAMGGDHAPKEIVHGAIEAVEAHPDVVVILAGQQDRIREELAVHDWSGDRIEIAHAGEVIEMTDHPVDALKQKRDSSIAKLVELFKTGQAEAVVSAGNTGAYAAACQFGMKKLPGVNRAGIAVVIPTFSGPIVVCDAGVNVAAKAHHLVQYGVMASIYAEHVIGIDEPRIGLLSIGEEDIKGTSVVKEAGKALREKDGLRFVGNVEGREIFQDTCDVVICDGFAGNITLKLTEGLAEGLFETIGREIQREVPHLMEEFKPVVKKIWAAHDYSEHGGAPLLGVNGVCIICHGRSTHLAIRNAVRVARECVAQKLNAVMTDQLAKGVGLPT